MNVIGYAESGDIIAEIDGVTCIIPDDMANRHRQEIATWEFDEDGNRVNTIPPYISPAPTIDEVANERDRRLSLGFDYDFQDSRGVHHFNTTTSDMAGWDLVTKLKDTLLQMGQTDVKIGISTANGPAEVTALEWNNILLFAATTFQQPLWQASFVLEAMNPIPADYTDDQYWSA